MKQLKKNFLFKKRVYKNNKTFTNKNYKIKIIKLKYNNNIKNNMDFYYNQLNIYRDKFNSLIIRYDFAAMYISEGLNDGFYVSRYTQFTSYVSSIQLIDRSYITGKFTYKYKYSLVSFFIPFLIKKGKKIFILNNVLNSISNIYDSIKYDGIRNLIGYLHIDQFKLFINSFKTNYNVNYLLDWIITIYKPIFDLKCLNVPKIHKKKNSKKVIFKYVYLMDKHRLKTANKHISLMVKKDTSRKIEDRIVNTFLDLLLNYKKSYLYTRKMFIYEKVIDL